MFTRKGIQVRTVNFQITRLCNTELDCGFSYQFTPKRGRDLVLAGGDQTIVIITMHSLPRQ